MKVILTSTEKVVQFEGSPARIWEGTTESGIKVHAYIRSIACNRESDSSDFEKDLIQHDPPSAEIAAIPMRLF